MRLTIQQKNVKIYICINIYANVKNWGDIMQYNTMGQRFRHAVYLVSNKPKGIMWLVLLGTIACCVITQVCGYFEIIGIPLSLGISAGISLICLKCVRNEDPKANDLFSAFKDRKTIKRVIGGQLFTALILLPWLLVPAAVMAVAVFFGYDTIKFPFLFSMHGMHDFGYLFDKEDFLYAGIFFFIAAIIICVFIIIFVAKAFEVAFVPYILISREDISPFDAWKESKSLTYGIRGRMLGFVILPALAFAIVAGILFALAHIPVIGSLFLVALTALFLFGFVILPYFLGLGFAGFYEAALHAPKIVYEYQQSNQQPSYYQPPQQTASVPSDVQPKANGDLPYIQKPEPPISNSGDIPENVESNAASEDQSTRLSSHEESGAQPLAESSKTDEN